MMNNLDLDIISLLSASIKLDLHGLTYEEANFELLRCLQLVDTHVRAIEIVHGYHNGTVLKKLVRNEFKHNLIAKKIPIDASRTLYVLDFNKNNKKNWNSIAFFNLLCYN